MSTHWHRWPGTLSAAQYHTLLVCTSRHYLPYSVKIRCPADTLGTRLSFILLCVLRCMSTLTAGVQAGRKLCQSLGCCNVKKAHATHAMDATQATAYWGLGM